MKYTEKYTLDKTVRLLIKTAIVLGIFMLIRHLSAILLPFVIGWFIAYLLYPLVLFIQRKMRLKYRILSVAVALIFVLSIITGISLIIAPMITAETERVLPYLSDYLQKLSESSFFQNINFEKVSDMFNGINFGEILSLETLDSFMGSVLPPFWGIISSVLKVILGIFSLFMIILYMIFILNDYEKLNEGVVLLFPKKYQKFTRELKSELTQAMNQYFRGQALIGLIVGILYCIGLSIIGLPMAIAMGLMMGVLTIVPYLHSIGFIPIIFFGFVGSVENGGSFGMMLLGIFIVFAVIQLLTDMYLVPKIMGKNMGLKPAIILLSLSIFGALLGFIGLIIALPVTTIIISYYKRIIVDGEDIIEQ